MQEKRKQKIFILGKIPRKISPPIINRYNRAERFLEFYNIKIANPIGHFLNKELSKEEALRRCIIELTESDAVYLLNETNSFYKKSLELRLAFSLNKTIIHQQMYQADFDSE